MKGKEDLLQAIHLELSLQGAYLKEPVTTIYIGGGTPSLLQTDEVNRLWNTIQQYYPIDHITEFTLEANPDDLSGAYLKALRQTPVTRLSIGVQSFHDADLRYMNRAHNAQQAEYAIKSAQDTGFTNLTIDLIYGTPGLDDAGWRHNIRQVAVLQIPHFSAYALTVETGTALHHAIHKKKKEPVAETQAVRQFELLMEMAEVNGYEHYEISNLALPGSYAQHNTNYWKGIPYLGIGPSAHSFDGVSRRWNVSNNALYTRSLLQQQLVPAEEEILTPVQQLNEYIMTSLRTMWGCDTAVISRKWGATAASAVLAGAFVFIKKKWLQQQGTVLLLTSAGKLYADHIAGTLFLSA